MNSLQDKSISKNRLELSKSRLAGAFSNLEAIIEQKIKTKNELKQNYQEIKECSLEVMEELQASIEVIEDMLKV
jgi:short-subunit dehydrogenase involved in D-alanine esterification of teichoic acids